MKRLENWSIVSGRNPYQAPELKTFHIRGSIYGDIRFYNGDQIVTSRVSSLNTGEKKLVTSSGSEYLLGEPDLDFIRWLEANGHKLEDYNK